ncbi:nicotinate-nucleotide adenylyltransferase [Clostridium sp. WILCCON 0269]|uniref:Probable nicotinate-nucleotide adenylyltransferase n=1 Tax=Candidatus Clostridium eludens TaxID=3381663 RepID=A0ABW8SIH8_9CLOT
MIKKAIFGGTFDPIHNGHIHIAYEAIYRLGLDKIVFMPTGNPPHKLKKNITDAFLRYEMVKVAIRTESKFTVSNYEVNKPTLSYTYSTLEHFNKLEVKTEWYFLTGADCLMDIEKWNKVDSIFKLCKFIVFNRPGFPTFTSENIEAQKKKIEDKYSTNIIYLDAPLFDISSTVIRNSVREGKNVNYFLPESVCNIINQLNLYK